MEGREHSCPCAHDRYLARERALGALETSQTVNARTTDFARTVGNFQGDRRELNIHICIYQSLDGRPKNSELFCQSPWCAR